jgi:hypothetical protein
VNGAFSLARAHQSLVVGGAMEQVCSIASLPLMRNSESTNIRATCDSDKRPLITMLVHMALLSEAS